MIDIAAAQLCRAQRDKLYGCYRRNAGELRRERRKREYGICRIRGIFKVGSTKENRVTAPRTNLGNVSRGLCVVKRVGGERRKDSSALDERQCSVLQLSCGICLAVNIGYFFQLQRAFGAGGKIRSSADKVCIVLITEQPCYLGQLAVAREDALYCMRQIGDECGGQRSAALCAEPSSQHTELYRRHCEQHCLSGIALGCGNSYLRSRALIEYIVRLDCRGRAYRVDYGERSLAVFLCQSQCGECVGGLA